MATSTPTPARVLNFDVGRRGGVVALDADTIAVIAGSALLVLSLRAGSSGGGGDGAAVRHVLPSRDGGGIGAVAVHPQRTHFAVAEKCRERAPNM